MSQIQAYILMINIDNIMEEVVGVFANQEDALKYAENHPLNWEVGYYIKVFNSTTEKYQIHHSGNFFIKYL